MLIIVLLGQLPCIKYILENRERLLPIFGSEAMGGPNTMGIYNKHSLPDSCEDTDLPRLFLEYGWNPWAVDDNGHTALTACRWSKSCIDLLLEALGFDINFINSKGQSHLDLALKFPSAFQYLITKLLDLGCVPSQVTFDILNAFESFFLEKISSNNLLRLIRLFPHVKQQDFVRSNHQTNLASTFSCADLNLMISFPLGLPLIISATQ